MEATDWQEQFCGTAPHARPLSGELYLNVCISRSWLYTPLLLLSVTSWEVSEVLHSPSYCLCPLWEQNICAHLLCPPEKRLMEDMPFVRPDQLVPWELGVCAWLVLMWYSLVRIYWRSGGHCASLQAPLLHLLSSGGAGALGMGEACCSLLLPVSFFIYCLDMWMELKRWNSKWEFPLCSSKKTEALRLCPWRGPAFTSHLPASRWWVIALQRRRFQWYTLPSRWEEVWGSCVSGLEEEIIVFR